MRLTSWVLTLGLLGHASAFVRLRPTSPVLAGLREHPIDNKFAVKSTVLLKKTYYRRLSATSPVAPSFSTENGLIPRVKTLAKNMVTGLPLVAFSTISGGMLAGSLHAVTGMFFILRLRFFWHVLRAKDSHCECVCACLLRLYEFPWDTFPSNV